MASVGHEVYVKLVSGQTVTLTVLPSDTVGKLADQVAEKAQVPFVQLKYQGKVLQRSHTSGYLGIRIETILKAEVVPVKTYKLTVNIKREEGPVGADVQVENLRPLQKIKELLKEQGVLPPGNVVLKIGTRVLSAMNQTLMEAGISDGDTLELQQVSYNRSIPEKEDDYTDADAAMVAATFDAGGRPVDVVFSFDTTGSMSSCLDRVRQRLRDICTRLLNDISQLRIGIIAHGDYCDCSDDNVLVHIDLTRDIDSLVSFVTDAKNTAGGDVPECYEWVLHKAQQMDWAEDSAKALVVIGDATPHPPSYTDQNINWRDEVNLLGGMGVKVYGVQAMDSNSSTYFYKDIAQRTGGAHIKFNNFQVITDMFLAVCYREADGDGGEEGGQLAAFMEELQQEGRLEGAVNDVIQQVAVQAPEAEPEALYLAEAWWDLTLDTATEPEYCYDQNKDKWTKYRVTAITTPVEEENKGLKGCSVFNIRKSFRRGKSEKKACAIM